MLLILYGSEIKVESMLVQSIVFGRKGQAIVNKNKKKLLAVTSELRSTFGRQICAEISCQEKGIAGRT